MAVHRQQEAHPGGHDDGHRHAPSGNLETQDCGEGDSAADAPAALMAKPAAHAALAERSGAPSFGLRK